MIPVREPNLSVLDDPEIRERDAIGYGIEALLWLYGEWVRKNPELEYLDPAFMDAVEAVILLFDRVDPMDAPGAARILREKLAIWRDSFEVAAHPLVHLGSILDGEVGPNPGFRGPLFLTTLDEVLEGFTHEFLTENIWDLRKEAHANVFTGLAVAALYEIAQCGYWALKAPASAQFRDELRRLFSKKDNRQALRGQMANLVLAGQVLSWKLQVEFEPEVHGQQTPDWSVMPGRRKFWVECTSVKRLADAVDDTPAIRSAIFRAWDEKRLKFSPRFAPGIIAVDISGMFISREFGAMFDSSHWHRLVGRVPSGGFRAVGVYRAKDDLELLYKECHNREMLGVIASILHSQEAQERGIQGFLVYQGQQVLVDAIRGQILLPKRGFFAWRGELEDDDEIKLAMALSQPAVANFEPAPPAPRRNLKGWVREKAVRFLFPGHANERPRGRPAPLHIFLF